MPRSCSPASACCWPPSPPLLGYSEWTVSDARHYTYDDVNAVPYNRVALVLGTSKYLIGGSPNHYFKYRIKAAAELYNNGKVDYILVSGDNATVQYNERARCGGP